MYEPIVLSELGSSKISHVVSVDRVENNVQLLYSERTSAEVSNHRVAYFIFGQSEPQTSTGKFEYEVVSVTLKESLALVNHPLL